MLPELMELIPQGNWQNVVVLPAGIPAFTPQVMESEEGKVRI
jgi:hypothetical protein